MVGFILVLHGLLWGSSCPHELENVTSGVDIERLESDFVARFTAGSEDVSANGGGSTDGNRPNENDEGGAGGKGDANREEGGGDAELHEPQSRCVSRNILLFGASSVSNLMGAYSAGFPAEWDVSAPWYMATLKWTWTKTKNGIASPEEYAKAWSEDPIFRQNNGINAILMGSLAGVECTLGRDKANAVVTAVAFLSSVAGQMLAKGEVSLSQTVLDVLFVRFLSLPRARLGGYIDRKYFQRHSPLARLSEVSAYYLGDQYLGGFGYGVLANANQKGWPDRFNVKFMTQDLLPLGDRIELRQ